MQEFNALPKLNYLYFIFRYSNYYQTSLCIPTIYSPTCPVKLTVRRDCRLMFEIQLSTYNKIKSRYLHIVFSLYGLPIELPLLHVLRPKGT